MFHLHKWECRVIFHVLCRLSLLLLLNPKPFEVASLLVEAGSTGQNFPVGRSEVWLLILNLRHVKFVFKDTVRHNLPRNLIELSA